MSINPRPAEQGDFLLRALRLLDRIPLVDGHNDLAYLIRHSANGNVAAYDLAARKEKRHTDIPRLMAGRVSAQWWAAFVPPHEPRPTSYALQQIAIIRRLAKMHPGALMPATQSADIARAKRRGRIACFTAIENGAAIENRLDTLQAFYDLGARLMTLCHNASTDWCDSATDMSRHGGITGFGRQVIAEMNRLGMLVDLSHASDAVMHQVLDISRAPVVFSHSNARALCNHPRNVPDPVLARVPGNGGIVMATFVPRFISAKVAPPSEPQLAHGPRPPGADAADELAGSPEGRPHGTLPDLCDHIDYLAAKVGHDHVGIGSDFFGGPQGEGLEDASCFPRIFAELIRRGWSEHNLRKLASGNFTRVFRDAERAGNAKW
jgi:membrane dipeptidase